MSLIPEPGVYRGVPADTYHSWPLCSSHALGALATSSPAHLAYERSQPFPTTPALLIGQAFHTLILEPVEFASRHPVATQCVADKKDGGRCPNPGKLFDGVLWYCGTHGKGMQTPAGALTEDQAQTVAGMADAIRCHSGAKKLLALPGDSELTVVFDRPTLLPDGTEYLLRCKMRADLLKATAGVCADLKTTEDAHPARFARSVYDYGYHRQAAHYLDGLAAAGMEGIDTFAILAVEKSRPHEIAAYQLDAEAIDFGRREIDALYQLYAQCESAGRWSGYGDDFEILSLPAWKTRQGVAHV